MKFPAKTTPNLKLRALLFTSFLLIATVPVLILAAWIERTAVDRETRSVGDKYLLIARNMNSALSRYAADTAGTFDLISTILAEGMDVVDADRLLAMLNIQRICILDATNNVIRDLRIKSGQSPGTLENDDVTAMRSLA